MSHNATNWAVKQRHISTAAKVVLWHLCDRHNPDHGCFVSQERLAEDCEISRSGLNLVLIELQGRGLVKRERRIDEVTKRQKTTFYRFPFEEGLDRFPSPNSGHGSEGENPRETEGSEGVEPSPNIGHGPSPENGSSRVQDLDTNPVREPVSEEERAREEQRKKSAALLDRLMQTHPAVAHDSRPKINDAWHGLSTADQATAVERHAEWLLDRGKRTIVAPLSIYLKERRWTMLPKKPSSSTGSASTAAKAAIATGAVVYVGAFDRAWWFMLWDRLAKERSIADKDSAARRGFDRMVSLARSRIGVKVEASEIAGLEAKGLDLVKLNADSESFRNWQHAAFASRGVTIPIPDAVDWVFDPPGDPEAWPGEELDQVDGDELAEEGTEYSQGIEAAEEE